MKYLVDFRLKNNDESISKNNIEAIYIKNKELSFKYDNESIKININNDNIIMQKENKDSKIIFNFILNKKADTKYYIKELDFYIDTEVLTNNLTISDKKIHIEYDLWLSGEYTGKFMYEIDIKEV